MTKRKKWHFGVTALQQRCQVSDCFYLFFIFHSTTWTFCMTVNKTPWLERRVYWILIGKSNPKKASTANHAEGLQRRRAASAKPVSLALAPFLAPSGETSCLIATGWHCSWLPDHLHTHTHTHFILQICLSFFSYSFLRFRINPPTHCHD